MSWQQTATVSETMTTDEVAELTGRTPEYVARLCREGRLEARKVGRTWLIHEDSVFRWLRTKRGPGRPSPSPSPSPGPDDAEQLELDLDK